MYPRDYPLSVYQLLVLLALQDRQLNGNQLHQEITFRQFRAPIKRTNIYVIVKALNALGLIEKEERLKPSNKYEITELGK
jgi:DNA-binding PadR family transcriptional regulator